MSCILFLGDVPGTLAARTAFGILDRRPAWCIDPMLVADGSGRIADHILAEFPL